MKIGSYKFSKILLKIDWIFSCCIILHKKDERKGEFLLKLCKTELHKTDKISKFSKHFSSKKPYQSTRSYQRLFQEFSQICYQKSRKSGLNNETMLAGFAVIVGRTAWEISIHKGIFGFDASAVFAGGDSNTLYIWRKITLRKNNNFVSF